QSDSRKRDTIHWYAHYLSKTMTLPSDTPIWHYCDLAKYVGILSRGLFFALPCALRKSDPWEGCCGQDDFTESLEAVHRNPVPNEVSRWREAIKLRRAKQDEFGLSCWHDSPTESDALWRLYAPLGLGVAVRSTPGKVQKALVLQP